MFQDIISFGANVCIIVISTWLIVKYITFRKYVSKYMDNIDKIIDNIEELEVDDDDQPNETTELPTEYHAYRDRLIGVAASGNAKVYLGKNITTSEIENLEEKEMLKLYSRYETYIGNVMTKSLKSAICGAYTTIMSALVPSVSKGKYMLVEAERLSENLIENPVINLGHTLANCTTITGITSRL